MVQQGLPGVYMVADDATSTEEVQESKHGKANRYTSERAFNNPLVYRRRSSK